VSEETTHLRFQHGDAPVSGRPEVLTWWATAAGLVLALVGVVDGILMALHEKTIGCPNGTEWPEGTTDFNCYLHPQLGVGVAIAVSSGVLAILVAFSSIVVRSSLKRASWRDNSHSSAAK
jgi:hypothetical protein